MFENPTEFVEDADWRGGGEPADPGLTELCLVRTRGHHETILRLTELFLPKDTEEDAVFKHKLQDYLRAKMPNSTQQGDREATEHRKRELKAQMKAAEESR